MPFVNLFRQVRLRRRGPQSCEHRRLGREQAATVWLKAHGFSA
jgi:hypothetical protein